MRAAIYARISRDRTGEGLGVARQEKDCRKLAERLGWEVAEVLTDNDISAYSRKRRPGFERLGEALRSGEVQAVLAWHPDRLTRHPRELEDLIDLIEVSSAAVATVQAGEYDLGTPTGRMVARVIGAMARGESEHKAERLKRKHLELAEAGRFSGGGLRPFGYDEDGVTLRHEEADEIRKLAARLLAGESLRGIVRDLNERGVASPTGALWNRTTLRKMLTAPRLVGLRTHHGRVVAKAAWPSILSEDEHLRLRALLLDPSRSQQKRPARTYLLSGFLLCGACGARLSAQPLLRGGARTHRYQCTAEGCYRVGILGPAVDEFITDAVCAALDTPDLAADVSATERPESTGITELENRLNELADLYADGAISKDEWVRARARLDERLRTAREALATETTTAPAKTFAGQGSLLREKWETLGLEWRRSVLDAVLDSVTIAQTTKRSNRVDLGRVSVVWRA